MSLLDLFAILRRRGWIILLVAVLTAGSAYAFSRLQTRIYQSTARILVQPSRPDQGLTQSAKTVLRSYVEWMRTRSNALQVINDLKMDTTPDALLGNITIASDESNFIIQIDVRDQNGDQANDIARTWADLFVQWRNTQNQPLQRQDYVTAQVLDTPTFTTYRPQTTVNTAAGAILGLLIGGVIVFVLEYFEANIIRSRQDAERALGLTVLGAIPALEPARRK